MTRRDAVDWLKRSSELWKMLAIIAAVGTGGWTARGVIGEQAGIVPRVQAMEATQEQLRRELVNTQAQLDRIECLVLALLEDRENVAGRCAVGRGQ